MNVDNRAWNERLLRRKAWLPPLFKHVKPGRIVEYGCGNGFVIENLSAEFPASDILGIDKNLNGLKNIENMNLKNVTTLKGDITVESVPSKSVDTALYVGVLHEIFSAHGGKMVQQTLNVGRKALRDDGILIIQDFLKPDSKEVELKFKNRETGERFLRFAKEFRPWDVKFIDTKEGVKLDIVDAVEFITKYRPPSEKRWKEEMGESHHYFTTEEFHNVINTAGFTIKCTRKLMNDEEYYVGLREDLDYDFPDSERAWIQLVLEKKGRT